MAKKSKIKRVLYFTNGHATQEDYEAAEEFGPGVVFRRADLIRDDGALEAFDGVAGEVPPRYAAKAAELEAIAAENPPTEAPPIEGEPVINATPVVPPKPATAASWKPNA